MYCTVAVVDLCGRGYACMYVSEQCDGQLPKLSETAMWCLVQCTLALLIPSAPVLESLREVIVIIIV